MSIKFLSSAWIDSYEMFSTLFEVQGISEVSWYIHHPDLTPQAALHHSGRFVDPVSSPHIIANLKSMQLAISLDQNTE